MDIDSQSSIWEISLCEDADEYDPLERLKITTAQIAVASHHAFFEIESICVPFSLRIALEG